MVGYQSDSILNYCYGQSEHLTSQTMKWRRIVRHLGKMDMNNAEGVVRSVASLSISVYSPFSNRVGLSLIT